jgi:epoxide hydrolase-like predicted phosphatase
MIKAIIFDCFGVLTTDHWKEFVAKLPAAQMEQARALMYQHDAGRLLESELLREVKRLTNQTPRGAEKLINDENIKNTELLAYIKELRPTYKVGLLSNIGSNWIREDFLNQAEQALFDEIILSYEVHMAKPDPEIFELAAKRLAVEPSGCVLIDDSAGHCQAARQQGMQAILYTDFRQMKHKLEPLLSQS